MSAIEWLSFISPIMWIVLILSVLALFPLSKTFRQSRRFQLSVGFIVATLGGWLLAHAALHFTSPWFRINVAALSKVILTPALIGLGVLLIIRLVKEKNWLTALVTLFGKGLIHFLMLFKPLNPFLKAYVLAAADSLSESAKVDHAKEAEMQRRRDRIFKTHINLNGNYSGRKHRNKY